MNGSEAIPVNTARRERDILVISECVICGKEHVHGHVEFDGDSPDRRAAHCRTGSEPPEYEIRLEEGNR